MSKESNGSQYCNFPLRNITAIIEPIEPIEVLKPLHVAMVSGCRFDGSCWTMTGNCATSKRDYPVFPNPVSRRSNDITCHLSHLCDHTKNENLQAVEGWWTCRRGQAQGFSASFDILLRIEPMHHSWSFWVTSVSPVCCLLNKICIFVTAQWNDMNSKRLMGLKVH